MDISDAAFITVFHFQNTSIMNPVKKAVIVTTEYRGVFFGLIDESTKNETTLQLDECRNVRYWSSDVDGFLGLSSTGPTKGCTIGKKAGGTVTLHKVTSVTGVSVEALEVWNKLP